MEEEQFRRRANGCKSLEQKSLIAKNYVPVHPHVYKLQEEFLLPELSYVIILNFPQNVGETKVLAKNFSF